MTIHFHPAPKPISPPKVPNLSVRKKNQARASENFKRAYHSRARQKWVNLQPCAACGAWGFSQNAHVLGNDGASRKGSFKTIAPLCGPRPEGGDIYQGCHSLFDTAPETFRERYPTFNPKRAAAQCQRAWIAYSTGNAA